MLTIAGAMLDLRGDASERNKAGDGSIPRHVSIASFHLLREKALRPEIDARFS